MQIFFLIPGTCSYARCFSPGPIVCFVLTSHVLFPEATSNRRWLRIFLVAGIEVSFGAVICIKFGSTETEEITVGYGRYICVVGESHYLKNEKVEKKLLINIFQIDRFLAKPEDLLANLVLSLLVIFPGINLFHGKKIL